MAQNTDETRPAEAPDAAAVAEAAFFDQQKGAFFRRVDWAAFWTTFLVSFGVYFHTMAPTVTLEDSGEMAVASDYLGVPHPPGYPIWTLFTWFFQWIFHWVKYFGQPDSNWMLVWKSLVNVFHPVTPNYPNPAWSVGMASAFFGALACALITLVISRSGVDMMRHLAKETAALGVRTETMVSWVCGVTGGLLLAFSPVLWSQCTIVEVYALNAFFMSLVILLTYRWMCRPHEDGLLFVTAFVFGLGLTNHQTLVFLVPAMGLAVLFRIGVVFRDGAARGLGRIGMIVVAIVIGVLFYLYLPIASEQNPPMNWGYPRTMEGFRHALGRGQYEKIDPIANLKDITKDPTRFGVLLKEQVLDPTTPMSITGQFSEWLFWPALILPFFLRRLGWQVGGWLTVLATSFLFLTLVFMVFQYLKPDVQTLFIGRVQFIQAHAIYAIWICYGLILLISWLDSKLGGSRAFLYAACAAVLAMPVVPLLVNAYDQQFLNLSGGSEQNQHDFGWQFGAWQLEGHRAILQEITEEEKKTYPNPAYPPPMDTNAVFFGGTDPGRFVPTYMIYSAHYREDVFLITQNALADNTYMNVMRDLYGDTIWIPAQADSNLAFQQYVRDVQEGKIPAGAEVSFEGGRVSVQGVQGVMMINGILARMIFDRNKDKNSFYVEESYVIPWMYPYLTPHGLIMKINKEPVPAITPETAKNDREYWDWHAHRLLGDRLVLASNEPLPAAAAGKHVQTVFVDPTSGARTVYIGGNPRFDRDVVARKTFSKLRGALAGIYTYRRMYPEAEYAFRQAIELYPLSPEANFRLADVFMQQFKFADARRLMEEFLIKDPENEAVKGFLNQIREIEKLEVRRRELEALLQPPHGADINAALELIDVYRRMNLMGPFEALANNVMSQQGVPPAAVLAIAQKFYESRRLDLVLKALERYCQIEPKQPLVWMDLAGLYASMNRTNEAVSALRQSISLGGDMIRQKIRNDPRFNVLRANPEFNRLVPPMPGGGALPLGGSPFGALP